MKKKFTLKSSTILYIINLVLMPFVMMFYQYQQNIEELFFGHILIFSVIVTAILIVLFFISRLTLKSSTSAFLFSGFFFICFFFLWSPYVQFIFHFDIFMQVNGLSPTPILSIALACTLLAVALLITFYFTKAKKSPKFVEKLNTLFRNNKTVIFVASAIIIILVSIFAYMHFFGDHGIVMKALVSYVALAAFIFVIAYIFFFSRNKNDSYARYTAPFFTVLLCVMLIMNSIPIIAFASAQETDDALFKQHFNVTKPLDQQPNVYWFWLDGMLGFDAVLQFFDENQYDFANELESRDFFINRDAGLRIIHGTTDAIPILMSPNFYDLVISWETDPAYAESVSQNSDPLLNPDLRLSPNHTALRTAREKNEIILAFNAAGFNTSTIATVDHFFFPNVDNFYCMRDLSTPLLVTTRSIEETQELFRNITYEQNFLTLLSRMSPLSIPLGTERLREDRFHARTLVNSELLNAFERDKIDIGLDILADLGLCDNGREHLERSSAKANILLDIFLQPEPRFVTIMCDWHHNSFGWVFDEKGNFNNENASHNLSRYAPHHLFINNLIIRYIDLIIRNDPDAVIVLQSDHGLVHTFNHMGIEAIMEHFNCTEEEALALRYSPMSAIRLPSIGGGVFYLRI